MPSSDQPHPDTRPHLVMMVGNHVVGDSRVEKSAVSAERAGYRVTILGIRHRTVFAIGQYEGIPIYRTLVPFRHHRAWSQWKALEPSRTPDVAQLVDGEIPAAYDVTPRDLASDNGRSDRSYHATHPSWLPSRVSQLTGGTTLKAQELVRSIDAVFQDRRRRVTGRAHRVQTRIAAGRFGGWRRVWPQIADYEESFLAELIRLQPDIIHAHDRHPMPAAAAYTTLMQGLGRHVPWIYDAHEWLPGQHIGGPAAAKTAWLAAEAQLIKHADAVLCVTEDLAERMRRRHHLDVLPATVINAPRSGRAPMDPHLRLPLREECGLEPDVPLLVYVGRMTELRGVFTMVEALPLLPEVHVAFVGSKDDHLRLRMRERAESLGVADRLHIFDYVPSTSVTWYIESATCGVSPLLPTPAHELAMATKLREYAQAGLPMVVSNLAVQAAFVTEHGIGTVYEAGDAALLAAATRRLLGDLESHRFAVANTEFLDSQTWEGAEKILARVWRSLCPAPGVEDDAEATSAHVKGIANPDPTRGRSLVLVGAGTGNRIAEAWSRHAGPVLTREGYAPAAGEEPRLSQVLSDWVETDSSADVILYHGQVSAYGTVHGGTVQEIRSLLAHDKAVGVLTGGTPLVDALLMQKIFPAHALNELTEESFGRYRRQVRRASEPLLALGRVGVPLFSASRAAAHVMEGVHWLPIPVSVPPAAPDDRDPSAPWTVLVVPALRSPAENHALDRMTERLQAAGHVVLRPRSSRFVHSSAAGADLVIDAVNTGEYTEAAAWAWSAGRLVIGGPLTHVAHPDLPDAPLIEATASSLDGVVSALVEGRSTMPVARLRAEGFRYATEVHDGRWSAHVIRRVLGLWSVPRRSTPPAAARWQAVPTMTESSWHAR